MPLAQGFAYFSDHERECSHTLFFFFFFLLFRATPTAHGVSQARDLIGATAAGLQHSNSNARSEPGLRPTPQLTASPDP